MWRILWLLLFTTSTALAADIDAHRVAAWNAFAEKIGQPGHPMAERFNEVLPITAGRLDASKIHSIFDLITADEREP